MLIIYVLYIYVVYSFTSFAVGGFNGGGDFSPFGGGNDAAGAFVNPTEDLPF